MCSQLSVGIVYIQVGSFQDRIGGRIHTFKSGSYVADLGAMVITGLGGNPLSVLKKQLGLQMSKIHRRCPLYFTTGKGSPPPPHTHPSSSDCPALGLCCR